MRRWSGGARVCVFRVVQTFCDCKGGGRCENFDCRVFCEGGGDLGGGFRSAGGNFGGQETCVGYRCIEGCFDSGTEIGSCVVEGGDFVGGRDGGCEERSGGRGDGGGAGGGRSFPGRFFSERGVGGAFGGSGGEWARGGGIVVSSGGVWVFECGGGVGDFGVAVEKDSSRVLVYHEAGEFVRMKVCVMEHHIFGAREGDYGMCGVVADRV